jgi:hypothetical protein
MAKRKRRPQIDPPPSPPVQRGLVSPMRTVPAAIERPDYAQTGVPSDRQSRAIRTPEEIDAMRVAGRVAADALIEVGRHIRPGVTTEELDRIGHVLGALGKHHRCGRRHVHIDRLVTAMVLPHGQGGGTLRAKACTQLGQEGLGYRAG